MLLVESVKVRLVRGDQTSIVTQRPIVGVFDPSAVMEETVKTEVVYGRRFVDASGEEFCIGLTKEVEDTLKLPFDVYENMERRLYFAHNDLVRSNNRHQVKQKRLENRLKAIKDMSFWERLNRVFVGFETLSLK